MAPPRWMQTKLQKVKRARKTYKKWIRSGGISKSHTEAYDIYNRTRSSKPRPDQGQDNTFMHVDAAMELEKLRDRLKVTIKTGNTKEYNAINKRIRALEKQFAPPPKKIVDPDEPLIVVYDENEEPRLKLNLKPRETVKPEWYVLELRREAERQEASERSERTFVRNELVRVWSGKRAQGITTLVGTTIEEAGICKLQLFFSGQEFVFVQTVGEERWLSATYTRQRAYAALAARRIAWISKERVTG